MSARLVDAGCPDRAGPGGVGAALRLDLTALDPRTIWTAAALVPVGALATVAFDAAGILIGLVGMWALQSVLAPWRVDETDNGARLRSIVGLSRRTVVAARYVWTGLLLTTIAVVFTLAIWGVGALLDRPVSEYLATLWIGSGAILFVLAAGVPARIRYSDATAFVVMLAAGVLFVAVMIGGQGSCAGCTHQRGPVPGARRDGGGRSRRVCLVGRAEPVLAPGGPVAGRAGLRAPGSSAARRRRRPAKRARRPSCGGGPRPLSGSGRHGGGRPRGHRRGRPRVVRARLEPGDRSGRAAARAAVVTVSAVRLTLGYCASPAWQQAVTVTLIGLLMGIGTVPFVGGVDLSDSTRGLVDLLYSGPVPLVLAVAAVAALVIGCRLAERAHARTDR